MTTARCAPLLADRRPRGAAGSVQSVLDASAPELLQGYCRQHLIAAIRAHGPVDISTQRNLLQDLYDHVARYQESFLVGGSEASDQDRAALIAAIGWCSGWRLLLSQLPLVVTENT